MILINQIIALEEQKGMFVTYSLNASLVNLGYEFLNVVENLLKEGEFI